VFFKILEIAELWRPKRKASPDIRKIKLKDTKQEHNQCGTPSCCGECDTATKQEEKKRNEMDTRCDYDELDTNARR
jgi:hypothetical protein